MQRYRGKEKENMRIFHLSDLHIGIRLGNYDLACEQEYMLEQVCLYVTEKKPDVLILAGDIYHKTVPSAESVQLFDRFLTRLHTENPMLEIMMIAGNHDSAQRIDYAKNMLNRLSIHIAGNPPREVGENLVKVTCKDVYGPVHFYLLPFVKPVYVRRVFEGETEPQSYEEAVKHLLERENIDFSERNVLVSHQFYLPVRKTKDIAQTIERMPSEVVTVGNIDAMDAAIIADFDYCALGHIHKPMSVGSDTIRYSGSPYPYSVEEGRQEKGIVMVDLPQKGEKALISVLPLVPQRGVETVHGSFYELTDENASENDNYTVVELTDSIPVSAFDMQEKLRQKYPYLLYVKRSEAYRKDAEELMKINVEKMDPYELFLKFAEELNDEEKELLSSIINEAKEEEF